MFEIDSILDAGRKSLNFSVSIEIGLVFVWVVDIDFDFSVGNQTWLDFGLTIGIDLFCVGGSKTYWF